MPFGVLELPDDLLAYLLSFLQNENKETLPLLPTPSSSSPPSHDPFETRRFLSSSRLLAGVRNRLLYWSLSDTSSDRFLQDSAFRHSLLSLMKDPSLQLHLSYSLFSSTSPLFSSLLSLPSFSLHTLELASLPVSRSLSSSLLSTLSFLASSGRLRCLVLHSSPSKLPSSYLSFSSLSRFVLEDCSDPLTSLHGLGTIPRLALSSCPFLKDISSLARGKTVSLDLSFNNKLRDLSPLRDCASLREIRLTGCAELIDPSPIPLTCLAVDLSHCSSLNETVDCLGNGRIQWLNLSSTPIRSVRGLGGIPTLLLADCRRLEDVSPLTSTTSLDITGCTSLKELPLACHSLKTLNLSHTSSISSLLLSLYPLLERLDLTFCSSSLELSFPSPPPSSSLSPPCPRLTKVVVDDFHLLHYHLPLLSRLRETNPQIEILRDFDLFVKELY